MAQTDAPALDAAPCGPDPAAAPRTTSVGMHALSMPLQCGDFGEMPEACAVLLHDAWTNGVRTLHDVIELKGLDTWPWSAADAVEREGMPPPGPMTPADARGIAALLVRAAEVVEQRQRDRGAAGAPGYRPLPRARDPKKLRLSRAG